jgi:hypothetical protein
VLSDEADRFLYSANWKRTDLGSIHDIAPIFAREATDLNQASGK